MFGQHTIQKLRAKIWDLNGREFSDMSIMSVGACILGYADDDIDDELGAIKWTIVH